MESGTGPLAPPARDLNWLGLIAILVAFALLPSLVDLLRSASIVFEFPDQAAATNVLIGSTTSLVVAVLAVSLLRWWPVVVRETLRMRGWVWLVPVTILVAVVALVDFAQLGQAASASASPSCSLPSSSRQARSWCSVESC